MPRESVTVSDAARVPDTVGEKSKVTVQLDRAARLVPQLSFATEKSPAFVPVIAMLSMLAAAVPEFVTVTDWVSPEEPTVTFVHETLAGLTAIDANSTVELQPVRNEEHHPSRTERAKATTLSCVMGHFLS